MGKKKPKRSERRNKRIQKRKERREARKKIIRLALDLYEDGDDAEELHDKVTESLESSEAPEKMGFFMMLLQLLLPMLIKMLTGVK